MQSARKLSVPSLVKVAVNVPAGGMVIDGRLGTCNEASVQAPSRLGSAAVLATLPDELSRPGNSGLVRWRPARGDAECDR